MKFAIRIEAGSAESRPVLGTTGAVRKLLSTYDLPVKNQKKFVKEMLDFRPAKAVVVGRAIISGVREE